MSSKVTPGRLLYSFVGVTTAIGCYLADWNRTHIYNERWPPHARFHNAQTMSMGLSLGLSTLYYTWRSPSQGQAASEKDSLWMATLLGSMYWLTQLSAILYPGVSPFLIFFLSSTSANPLDLEGTLFTDPEYGEGHPQLYICMVLLSALAVGNRMELSRMAKERKVALE
jgi:hypothetical protein